MSRVLSTLCPLACALLLACFSLAVQAQPALLQPDLAVGPPPGARGADAKFRFSFEPVAAWPATIARIRSCWRIG